MKPGFERPIAGAVLLLILLLLVGCRQAAIQEVTPSPASTPVPTPVPTPLVAASPTSAKDPLNGTRWVLLSLYGQPPLEGTRITLEFSGGFIRGFAGCNKYDRAVIGDDFAGAMHKATEDGSLMVPVLAHTLLACLTPEGGNDQEKTYLKALHSAVAFRLVENHLELQDAAGETILVFTR